MSRPRKSAYGTPKKSLLDHWFQIRLVIAVTIIGCGFAAHYWATRKDDPPGSPAKLPGRFQGERIRAMTLTGAGPITEADLQPLKDLGVNTLVLVAWGGQHGHDNPVLEPHYSGPGIYWGETDEGLRETARIARSMGFRLALKPHIWLFDEAQGNWCGRIRMKSEADWDAWFASYIEWILHYAVLAREIGAEVFCMGVELDGVTRDQTPRMRKVIARVREQFPPPGKLTFSANWDVEFERIAFWDDLDYIGVNTYFELRVGERPTAEQIHRAWEPYARRLERVSTRYGKPVLFTEMGYKSRSDAVSKPHLWPEIPGGAPDEATQAAAYEGFFQAFWERPWVAGVWAWTWFPNEGRARPYPATDFTPQGKQAEKVLARWFTGDAAAKNGAAP